MNLIKTIRDRGLLWVTVHTSLWLFDRFFEYVLSPYVILKAGLVGGTAIMMAVSAVICWILIAIYDYVSTNWVRDALGFETLKEAAQAAEEAILDTHAPQLRQGWWLRRALSAVFYPARFVFYVIRRFIVRPVWIRFAAARRPLIFLYLSLFWDPMTCMIMLRPPYMHTMGKREWGVFLTSVIVSNAAWALVVWAGVETLTQIFPVIWAWVT